MAEIFSDEDVHSIFVFAPESQPALKLHELDTADLDLVKRFVIADQNVTNFATPPMIIEACDAGVKAFEGMSDETGDTAPDGWRKFIVYMTGHNVNILWHQHHLANEACMFADWVVATIEGRGWKTNGPYTALGAIANECMAIPALAGGPRINPHTGQFEAATGEQAREFDIRTGAIPPIRWKVPEGGASGQARSSKRGLFRRR